MKARTSDGTSRSTAGNSTSRFVSGRDSVGILTVVECKNQRTAVPVKEVQACVTKAADAHANRWSLPARPAFNREREPAQAVAQRYNITLIKATDSFDVDFSAFGAKVVDTIDALQIHSIELEYTDGERKILPEESNK
jgi:hypothetical protein